MSDPANVPASSPEASSEPVTTATPISKESAARQFSPPVRPIARPNVEEVLNEYQKTEARGMRARGLGIALMVCFLLVLIPAITLFSTGGLQSARDRFRRAISGRETTSAPAAGSNTDAQIAIAAAHDPVAKDLRLYLVALRQLAPLEQAAMSDYWDTTGAHYKSDAYSAAVIRKKVVPEYRRYIDTADTIHPQTPDVAALHQKVIKVGQQRLAAFIKIGDANGSKDPAWRKAVTDLLAPVPSENSDIKETLQSLIRAHAVVADRPPVETK